MSLCYVENVNIVPQARAIRGRIVISMNLEYGTFARGSLQQQGDDVRFRAVILPGCSSSSASIEVTKGCLLYTSDAADE